MLIPAGRSWTVSKVETNRLTADRHTGSAFDSGASSGSRSSKHRGSSAVPTRVMYVIAEGSVRSQRRSFCWMIALRLGGSGMFQVVNRR